MKDERTENITGPPHEHPQAERVQLLTAEQAQIPGHLALERGREMDTIHMLESVYGTPNRMNRMPPPAPVHTIERPYALPCPPVVTRGPLTGRPIKIEPWNDAAPRPNEVPTALTAYNQVNTWRGES